MIFKTYRELINYILSEYPYQRILNYCKELHYKWAFRVDDCLFIREPTIYDVKKYLLCTLASTCRRDIVNSEKEPSQDDERIMNIYMRHDYKYFESYFRRSKKELVIKFKYSYSFSSPPSKRYSLPKIHHFGDHRTTVVFKFNDEII